MKTFIKIINICLLLAIVGCSDDGGDSSGDQSIYLAYPLDGKQQFSVTGQITWLIESSSLAHSLRIYNASLELIREVPISFQSGSYLFSAGELESETEYYWEIARINASGGVTLTSERRRFTTAKYESGIHFEDVSSSFNIDHTAPSYGISWGDFNSDQYPDLWVGNHYSEPSLYVNNDAQSFTDIAGDVWSSEVRDTHGAVWHDIDDDGDQDIIEMVGGVAANHVWINEQDFLRDGAADFGLENPGARSRTPLLVDYDKDKDLDLVITQLVGTEVKPVTMRRDGAQFVDSTALTGAVFDDSDYAQLADLNNDDVLEIILHGVDFPLAAYDYEELPFADLVSGLDIPAQGGSTALDTVIADFDGDLLNDIFVIKQSSNRDLISISNNEVHAKLTASGNQVGVRLKGADNITIEGYFFFGTDPNSAVSIGASNSTISVFGGSENLESPEEYTVTLNTSNSLVEDAPTYSPGATAGQFVWYDTVNDEWLIYFSSPTPETLNLIITTSGEFSQVEPINFTADPTPSWPNFYKNTGDGFEEARRTSGLGRGLPCNSAVGEDFDNDMDIDLYLVCSMPINNVPNILLQNDGDGKFTLVELAGGAEGSLVGRGDSVATADYDLDGFIDLFITNGEGRAPFHNGPHQLFKNQGNPNHWLEIDLVGRFSNAKGIGSIVLLEAGGKQQIRTQSGGMHRHSQNYQRIHFGLGSNRVVSSILIKWPSGIIQTINNVAADQLLVVEEASQEECSDGVDNDDDGNIDYPLDDTCLSWSGTE